jgi:hypothetical protein
MRHKNALFYGLVVFHSRCICSLITHSYRGRKILARTSASASAAILHASSDIHQPSPNVEDILSQYGYDRRKATIQPQNLPLIAELYENGNSTLVSLESFVVNDAGSEPKALIRYITAPSAQDGKEQKIISFGDITTIWHEQRISPIVGHTLSLEKIQQQLRSLKAPRIERALDRLYNARVRTSRSSSNGITKKQVGMIAHENFADDQHEMVRVESLLRQVIKAGVGSTRLVSSDTMQSFVYKEQGRQADIDRAVASIILSKDATHGGRFKRFPCMVVRSEITNDNVSAVTIINGGWLVSDQSVRAGAEGRQFAERSQEMNEVTRADERIIRRLECLALGETFSTDELQVDVRETLKAMDLPLSKNGATDALVRIGRWSGNEDLSKLAPWSPEIVS